MTKVYYTEDCDISVLMKQTTAIIGFGSQGRSHALNLRDSGIPIIIGAQKGGSSWNKAIEDDFTVLPIADATSKASLIMLLIPDEIQAQIYATEIAPNISKNATLCFAHGFNIHYGYITPPKNINVMMVAPKAQGKAVRSEYLNQKGVASLIAIQNDCNGNTKELALAYALALGSGKMGIIETSFKDETETDLFGEQAVLCGGMMELVKAGFNTLTNAGYPPEMAYFECLHELKLVVDLLHKGGYSYMKETISNTAEYGAWRSGKKIINEDTSAHLQEILHDIQSGKFAEAFMTESQNGYPNLQKDRKETTNSLIEATGKKIRAIMNHNKQNQ